jgi:hypothetical protein
MPPKKVLMITKVTVHWDKLEAFNEWWEKGSLPTWRTHGANYIGSYENYLGGKKNEIIRVTEFDDFKKWEKWMEWRNTRLYGTDPTSQERAEQIEPITSRVESIEESVWFLIY